MTKNADIFNTPMSGALDSGLSQTVEDAPPRCGNGHVNFRVRFLVGHGNFVNHCSRILYSHLATHARTGLASCRPAPTQVLASACIRHPLLKGLGWSYSPPR
jgi:hypothetical protein